MRGTASLLKASVDRKEQIFPVVRDWQNKLPHTCFIDGVYFI